MIALKDVIGVYLFKIWIFDFNFSSLISFIIGIFMGIIILLLIYAIMVISSLGNKKFIIPTDNDTFELRDVKVMVEQAQAAYKNKELRGKKSRPGYCFDLVKDLIYGIAYVYAPKSKYPIFELTLEEEILLATYISNRINELLDRKGVRLLKKLKVSQIMSLTKKTNDTLNNEVVKTTLKASKFKKVIDYLNIINPYKIFKIQVVDRIINLIIDKLCLIIIAVSGEETYKIYSKKAFTENNEISDMIDDLIDSMDKDVDDAKKEVLELANKDNTIFNNNTNIRFKSYTNFKPNNNTIYESCYNSTYRFRQDRNVMEDKNEKKA